jgi:hypothetical protein
MAAMMWIVRRFACGKSTASNSTFELHQVGDEGNVAGQAVQLGDDHSLAMSAAIRRANSALRLFAPPNGPPNISYNKKMEWGQVSIFLAVACFAAIVLFMVNRKPHA